MKLTVKPLKSRDPGSGMAVIDRQALSRLGVSSGDFVAIEGEEFEPASPAAADADPLDAIGES